MSRLAACIGLTTTRGSTVSEVFGGVHFTLCNGLDDRSVVWTAYSRTLWKTARLRLIVLAPAVSVPYAPFLQELYRQVVEVDLEDRDPGVGQPVLDPLPGRPTASASSGGYG